MASNILEKIGTLASHHQLLLAIIVAVSLICATWCIEKILEEYVFTKKRGLWAYLVAIGISLLALWLVKHYLMHAI